MDDLLPQFNPDDESSTFLCNTGRCRPTAQATRLHTVAIQDIIDIRTVMKTSSLIMSAN
jgi:hypothetical protein